jgi:hypothetical protein
MDGISSSAKVERLKRTASFFGARMAAASLSLVLGLIVFLAAREMFGDDAALFALALGVFEPNMIAHGANVTTDTGISCFIFASMYPFYRYVKAPSVSRLIVLGLVSGLALASKHSEQPVASQKPNFKPVRKTISRSINPAAGRFKCERNAQ